MPAKKYLLMFAGMLLFLAGFIVLLNRVIDPFWYYRDISIEGLNAIKPKFQRYERHVKPSIVRREQPASLIFGSSFAEIGFDPVHPALNSAGGAYNFAFAGATWEMMKCSAQFALKHDSRLRRIVVGIHPVAMPAKDCLSDIEKMEDPDERAFLFSRDALQASINTMIEQRREKPSHTLEGRYIYARGVPGTENRFREYFARYKICDLHHVVDAPPTAVPMAKKEKLDLGGLRELIHEAEKTGVAVKLVVYPRHALYFEQEYQCGNRQSRWDLLEQIVSAAENASGVEVWDFEGYHSIGTERISSDPKIYWQDPGHFNYEVGNIMLDEMFGLRPQAMGQRLTPANIAPRIEAERKARAAYLREHPDFLRQLEELLPKKWPVSSS